MYYNQMILKKVEDMFEDLKKQSYEIIDLYSDASIASKMIVDNVSSELDIRSKTLFTDMYAQMSKKTLSSSAFDDLERKSRFYKANIKGDILAKYKFDITTINAFQRGIQYKEIRRLYSSFAAAAGTAAVGGVLKYIVVTAVNIPMLVIAAGAVAVFCISYFKTVPNLNREAFRKAVEKFLSELKKEFILWFEKIEIYYNRRIDSLVNTF